MKENNDVLTKDVRLLRWDLHEQKEQLAKVKPILEDVNELKDNFKSNMDQTQQLETKVDGLRNDIDIIVEDSSEQKEQLANVEQHMTDANELRDKCEINWKQTEQMQVKLDEWITITQVLTQDLNEQKQHMAIVTHAVKDVKELRDECEHHWEQTQKYSAEFTKDIKLLRQDLDEHKKQLANVNALITDVKDKCETNCNHIKTMEMKVEELVSNAQVLMQDLHEQKGQLSIVTHAVKDVEELRDECERHWQRTKKFNDDISSDLKIFKWDVHEEKKQLENVNILITEMKDKCESNCDQTEAIEMKVEELVRIAQVLTQGLNEQKGQLTDVEQLLQDNGSSAAVEMQQLKSQLEQQATLINTNNTQENDEIKKLNVRMLAMQSAVEVLRAKWESNWSEEKVQRGDLSMDLDDLKQQLVEARQRIT